MTKNKAGEIITRLEKEYPNPKCTLEFSSGIELLVATRLSAQCTDERVNKTTPELFEKYKSAEDFANADIKELEKIIKPCGFYRIKAKSIIDMCQTILNDFGGKVPDNMEDLLKLSGVGRKTANLILGELYGKPAYITDTHCIRISNRLGFADSDNPLIVEKALRKLVPPEKSLGFCHRTVEHGRKVCKAINPKCDSCAINDLCKFYLSNKPKKTKK